MRYDLRLKFAYRYSAVTGWGYHLLRLTPRTTPTQRLISSRFSFDPVPTEIETGTDFFGNERTLLFREGAHDHFNVVMEAQVEVNRPLPGYDVTPPWRDIAAAARGKSLEPRSPVHALSSSRLVRVDDEVRAMARAALDPDSSIFAAAMAMNRQVYDMMSYVPQVTGPRTESREAFQLRMGVCQDYAHVMIAALRSVGIPAAYVSGLIRTVPDEGAPRLEGADAMHAWVDVWCGDAQGWVGFDPTNGIIVCDDHVVVAVGRDYADVAPIDGVIVASTAELKHSVDLVPV